MRVLFESILQKIVTSLMDGRQIGEARMQRDAANASRLSCVASYSFPSLGSINFLNSPMSNIGFACCINDSENSVKSIL